jgi:hypothetical protein
MMKIDNENRVVKIQVLKYIYAILILTLLGVLYTTTIEEFTIKYLGLSNPAIMVIFIAAYLAFYFYHLAIKTSYLFFSDEGYKIIIRFYPLRPINPKKSSIEIPKNQFYKFSVIKSFLKEEVIVFQKNGSQVMKYPAFSLKGLSKEERSRLLTALEGYVQKENV